MKKKTIIILFLVFILSGCTSTFNEIYNKSYNVDIDLDQIQEAFIPAVEKATEASIGVVLFERSVFMGNYSAVSVGSGVVYDGYALTNSGEVINDIKSTTDRNDIKSYTYKAVTNEHVLTKNSNNTIVKVYLGDLDYYIEASILGTDKLQDLAVITFTTSIYITPIVIANSDNLKQGEMILAVGNPEGLEYYLSVSFGIVSFPKRYVEVKRDTTGNGVKDWTGICEYIQHDAAINPGNSGGALVNIKGELIGINAMKIMDSEDTIEGLGFAIPSNVVKKYLPYLETNTKYQTLKVEGSFYSINQISNRELYEGIPNIVISENYNYYYGIFVGNVKQTQLGLYPSDIIMEIGGVKMTNISVFYATINILNINDTFSCLVFRNNQIIQIDKKLR